jgi:hypothetical protein
MLLNPLIKLTILTLCLVSCKTKPGLITETFVRILPDSQQTYNPEIRATKLQIQSKELDLLELNKAVDSFNLRVWQTSMISPQTAVDFAFNNKKWSATIVDFYNGSEIVDSFKTRDCSSKITPILIDQLTSYDFISIPSQDDIPNFQDKMADGVTYTIEISTKRFYKLLIYHCPNKYANEPNNKRILELIHLLDTYFEFYKPFCGS